MDRIDLYIRVGRPDASRLLQASGEEGSASVRERVAGARHFAAARGSARTAELSGAALLSACRLSPRAHARVESLARASHLSGRAVTRLLRVARTIADLEGQVNVSSDHVTEAAGFRFDTGGEEDGRVHGSLGTRVG